MHPRELLGDAGIGHVLRQAVRTQQQHVTTLQVRASDIGNRLRPTHRAREHVGERAPRRNVLRQRTGVDEILCHRLIARELTQRPAAIQVEPTVTDVQYVQRGPHRDVQGERRRRRRLARGVRAREHRGMTRLGRVTQRGEKRVLVGLVGRVERVHRLLHVLGDRLDRRAARRLAAVMAADAIRHHAERRDALARQLEQLGVGQTRRPDARGLVKGRHQVVILVVLPDLSGMRDPEKVDLLVAWLRRRCGCPGRWGIGGHRLRHLANLAPGGRRAEGSGGRTFGTPSADCRPS